MNVFQRSIVDEAGNIMPLAAVEVRDQVTSNLVQLYDDYDGASPIGNPTAADANGFVRFYVAAGRYRIEATSGALSRTWEDEVLGLDGALIEHRRTPAESVTPTSYQYHPGDPRRYHTITLDDDEIVGLYSFGHVPIFVDSDTFKVSGDVRSSYPDRTRLAVFDATTRIDAQILSTAFAAGQTTVEVRTEIGNLPATPIAIAVYRSPQIDHMYTHMVDYNAAGVFQIVNKNTGTAAATQLTVGDFVASGLGIIATKSTTLPTPGYYYLAPNNPIAAFTTGLNIPIVIVTQDVARVIIPGDGVAIQTTTDFVVQRTNDAGVGGGTTSTSAVDGTATGAFSIRVASVEQAIYTATTTQASLGTVVATPLVLYSNGVNRLTLMSAGIADHADDAAAAAGGVPVTGIYRTGSILKVRVA